MAQAEITDRDELDSFIRTMEDFNSEIEGQLRNLQGNWSELGQVWRDQKYQEFAEKWEETVQLIQNYLTHAPEYVSHLQTKLRQVDEFLNS